MEPNPFTFQLDLPWYRIPQVVIMSIVVVPIRLIVITVLETLAVILSWIIVYGLTDEDMAEKPLTGWRRKGRSFIYCIGRLMIALSGFTFVKVKGEQVTPAEAPTLVVAPHSSLLDTALIFLLKECPGVICKRELAGYPVVGDLLRLTQPILVSTGSKDSNRNVIDELTRRANSNGLWHQNMIFSEGTTSNRKALLPFKPGAFIAGKPVQPVTLRYTDEWDTVTWTWVGGPPGGVQGWLSMCKWNIGLTVEFLPVYHPSEDEQKDPQLYADNVRILMARSLGVPCSQLTREDGLRLYKEWKRYKGG